jgi:hypothetical protein
MSKAAKTLLPEGREQRIHLAGVADAELHHQPGARGGGDGGCVVFQQGDFPLGEGVFRLRQISANSRDPSAS